MSDLKLLILGSPDPRGTGGERRSWHILNTMAELGVELLVVIDEFCKASLSHANFEAYRLKGIAGELLRPESSYSYPIRLMLISMLVKELRKHISEFRPDLIVSHDEAPWNIYAAYLASHGKPWTTILQELPVGLLYFEPWIKEVVDWYRFSKNIMKTMLHHWIFHALNTTVPVLVSEALALRLKLLNLKLKHHISLDIPIGLDWSLINKTRLQEKKYDVVYMARLVPEKGIYDLIHIWEKVADAIRHAKLCVIGKFHSHGDRFRLERIIRRYGLQNNISLKGYLEPSEKFSVIKSSKIFLYPSRQDSFPISVLEALACGLPVVAYGIPAMIISYPTDAVVKVKIGDYDEMALKTIRLLTDHNLYTKLKSLTMPFCSKYTWKKATENELKAYENILGLWHELNK